MFLKNCWYCAGWEKSLSMGQDALETVKIAGESILIYRTGEGKVIALEDRCCHRHAPLSLGRKEGDSIRCMYHGWKFAPTGECVEIPGQRAVTPGACVRNFPVFVKDGWIWVWMGEPAAADETLICDSITPEHPEWDFETGHLGVHTNYRQEIANLTDLNHIAWVHENTFGGTTAYSGIRAKQTIQARGIDAEFWLRSAPAPSFARHLYPDDARFDLHFSVKYSVPCNFLLRFKVYSAGTATEGPSDGELLLDTYSGQAITPRDEESVDYYYSWGVIRNSTPPGLLKLMKEANDRAFLEDKRILEGQFQRMKEKPDAKTFDYAHDAGPGKMLWILDNLLKKEREVQA